MIWYLPNLLFILLVCWWLKPEATLRKIYWNGLLVKLLAGIVLGLIYFAHIRGGDTVEFHHNASQVYGLFLRSFSHFTDYLFTAQHPAYMSEARNELFVKLLSIFYIISGGDYWISSLYLSLISFSGAWYLVRTIHGYYPEHLPGAVVAFLFLPSAVFWSSGVLKDPLVNSAIFFLGGIALRYDKNNAFRWWEICFTCLALLLLFYLKYYLFAMAVLILGCMSWARVLTFIPQTWQKTVLSLMVLSGLILLASKVHWNLNFAHLPEAIHTNYLTIHKNSPEQHTLNFPNLKPEWHSLLVHLPQSLFAGLFRPLPGEGSLIHIANAVENLVLFLLACFNLYFLRKIKISLPAGLVILYILILASVLPLASPNFGSLIRYKAAYLSFLFFILSIIPLQEFRKKRKQVIRN